MGIIYKANKDRIRSLPEETVKVTDVLIEPGKTAAEVKLAPLSREEYERILLKLDMLAIDRNNEAIAVMVAEEVDPIITLIRMVKVETKEEFTGILGSGANLDITWLRPKDVGGPLLNSAGASNKGLYGGANGGVYSWLHTFTANTSEDIIPEQIMAKTAGVIHLGAIDPVEVPKVNAIQFTIAGIPSPAQSMKFNIRSSFGTESLPFVRFEKPVIVGPEKRQKITVMPNISGDSKLELLSLLVTKAEALTL
ncbi:MAG: hypothetical protein QXW83_00175 [Nitrososphaerales archaeon]